MHGFESKWMAIDINSLSKKKILWNRRAQMLSCSQLLEDEGVDGEAILRVWEGYHLGWGKQAFGAKLLWKGVKRLLLQVSPSALSLCACWRRLYSGPALERWASEARPALSGEGSWHLRSTHWLELEGQKIKHTHRILPVRLTLGLSL